jgi:hypothetical protein
MAARGSYAKEQITNKLMEIYGGDAAVFDKVLRIRIEEEGVPVEIKVTLTAAKDNLMSSSKIEAASATSLNNEIKASDTSMKPSEEEVAQIDDYIKQLERLNMI